MIFTGGTIPCDNAADSNDDGTLNIADGIALLGYLFNGAPPPPPPLPRLRHRPDLGCTGVRQFCGVPVSVVVREKDQSLLEPI